MIRESFRHSTLNRRSLRQTFTIDSEQLPQAAIASGVLRNAQNSTLKSATRI
jgi:hypothetical protein